MDVIIILTIVTRSEKVLNCIWEHFFVYAKISSKQWVNCVSNPFATGHWRYPPYESLRQKRVINDKSVDEFKNKTICMHCVVCTVTSVVFMQSVSDYAATSCTTRNKFHDLRSLYAKFKSAWEPGCWFENFSWRNDDDSNVHFNDKHKCYHHHAAVTSCTCGLCFKYRTW